MRSLLLVFTFLMVTTFHVKGQAVSATGELVFSDEVERIESKAYAKNKEVTRVVLPKNLKQIGDSAFYECTNLEEIVFPEGLEAIGRETFYGVRWLYFGQKMVLCSR